MFYVRKIIFQKYKKKEKSFCKYILKHIFAMFFFFGNTFRDTYSNLTSAHHVYLLHILTNWMMITNQFCLSNFIWFKFIHSFFIQISLQITSCPTNDSQKGNRRTLKIHTYIFWNVTLQSKYLYFIFMLV